MKALSLSFSSFSFNDLFLPVITIIWKSLSIEINSDKVSFMLPAPKLPPIKRTVNLFGSKLSSDNTVSLLRLVKKDFSTGIP